MNSLCQVLQAKQAVLDQTLDGAIGDDGVDVHDLLTEHLKKTNSRKGAKK